MNKIGFDSKKYVEEQSRYIAERVSHYDKLYLEFGGKIIGDKHAKRVLPGFDEDAKIKILQRLSDKAEIVICVYAGDIERNKIRGDYGITYDMEVFRLIDEFRSFGLSVNSVVITRYHGQPNTKLFINKLKKRDMKVYTHKSIEGYPSNVDMIVSKEGFGSNPYIETTKPIVVMTAPGGGSGKLATCLNQLYHENQQGRSAGYSKFETFPVWNISLKHPLNMAYEAATVDLKDMNMIDNFHFEAYKEVAVNYNRDIEIFPVIKRIIERITKKESIYQSPTDMGVNRVGFGIVDDEVVREASNQEIIRRSFTVQCDYKKGLLGKDIVSSMQILLDQANLKQTDRPAVQPARDYAKRCRKRSETNETPAVIAFELKNGQIVTGRTSNLMDSSSAAILNSIKQLANVADEIPLLSLAILETIQKTKSDVLRNRRPVLNANEILIALAISAVTNPTAQMCYNKLYELEGVQAHSTVMLKKDDEQILRNLGIDITSDPEYPSENLYYI